jgi:hypothetical protein
VGQRINTFCPPHLTACACHREPHHRLINNLQTANCNHSHAIMSQFRAAKLDIGCFVNIRNIRDHTKRKVFMENEPERYASSCVGDTASD